MFGMYPKRVKVYLTVPFNKKDVAKQYKCFWDGEKKMWYKNMNTEYDFQWNDYKDEIYGLIEYFNDLFQFNYHHVEFSSVFYDEEGFHNLLKESYALQQARWLSGETKADREAEILKRLDERDKEREKERQEERQALKLSKIKMLNEPPKPIPKPLAIPVRRESVSYITDPFDD